MTSEIVKVFSTVDFFFSSILSRIFEESLLCNRSGDEPARIGRVNSPEANVTLLKDEGLEPLADKAPKDSLRTGAVGEDPSNAEGSLVFLDLLTVIGIGCEV